MQRCFRLLVGLAAGLMLLGSASFAQISGQNGTGTGTSTTSAIDTGQIGQPAVIIPITLSVPSGQGVVLSVQGVNQVLPISLPRLTVPTGPITVDQAVGFALSNNASYQVAEQRYLRSRDVIAETRGTLLGPQLRTVATYTRQQEITTVFGEPPAAQEVVLTQPNNFVVAAALSQPIDITGVLRASVDIAKLNSLIQEIDLRRVRQQIAYDTRVTFFNVIRARQFLDVTRVALTAAQEHLRVARQQFDAGTLSQFDVLRAEVQVANFNQNYLSAQNQLNLAEAALNTALGLPGGTVVQLTEPPAPVDTNPDIDASIAQAQRSRPEVLESQAGITLSQRGIVVARRGLLPSLALTGNYSVTPTAGAFGSDTNWNVGAALSIPIFDAGVTRARVREARRDVNVSELSLAQLQEGIALEVRQSIINLRDAQARLVSAQANLNQATEALRLANVRFEAGVSTQVEVTDAQVAFTQAETNYVNALNDVRQALARYDHAIGTPV